MIPTSIELGVLQYRSIEVLTLFHYSIAHHSRDLLLFNQMHVRDAHLSVDGFAHIINR
jgi:hypothetical protein